MVLKDVQCRTCGGVCEEMCDACQTEVLLECAPCGKRTRHRTLCLGGTKVITWGSEGVNPEDYIEQLGVKAGVPRKEDIGTAMESVNAEPVRHVKGHVIHDTVRFKDGIKDRQSKRRWARERSKNGPKLHFS